ncbi:MAG TPA: efflux RND transporter periplasmic adaptor subunit [Chthoniobacterales bacterium]|jgi:multidrug efflux system membrane fusion protein|nr:efflux RND transporter periplasmic adaptor subunit [Chthoniobacterales bacterium]
MSKRTIIIIAGVVLLLFVWWTCRRGGSTAEAQTSGRNSRGPGSGSVPVVAAKVQQKDVPIYLNGLGTVQAFNTVTVRARVDGNLTKILFQEGQDVKAGDLLAVVDPNPYQAVLDQAKAQAALDQATLKRQQDLRAKNVVAAQDYDTAVANAQKSQAAAEAAQVNVDYCSIKSPIDGRTGIRLVDVGNVIHASDQTGIVVITQLRPISVLFTLPEQNLQDLANNGGEEGGLLVSAFDRGNTTQLGDGKLTVVDNQIDQTTGTIKLKATFPNDDLKLWPGKFVNARLVLTTRKNALVVPASVVQRGPQGTYAYVIKPDKTAEMRAIKVAQTENNLTVVDDGLKAGEDVVVDGQYKLQPGAHVELTSAPGQTAAESSPSKSPRSNRSPKPAKS